MDVKEYLGPLLFVKIRKWHLLQNDAWFCNWISVQGPGASGDEFRFPCYRWVEGNSVLTLPEGTGEEASAAQETLGVGERRRGNRTWGQEPEGWIFLAGGGGGLLEFACSHKEPGRGVRLKGQIFPPSPQGWAEKGPLSGTGGRPSGEAPWSMPSSALVGRTLADDPQGQFKKYREEELEGRRKLYQ